MRRDIIDYLTATRQHNGSDLHLTVGSSPLARIDGRLTALEDEVLDAATCRDLIMAVLTDTQRAKAEKEWELDFAINVAGVGRFRGNAHFSRNNMEAAFRFVPSDVPVLEDLGHTDTVAGFCQVKQGLVLVTGMAGTGKSTTLAAMTRRILETRKCVVVTVEDPIEFIHEHRHGLVKQRQIGHDTVSFPAAIKTAMRQDVNVIAISEMRDLESISAAITAAESGHLVLATLHTRDAVGALDRMVDVFPASQQPQIITQLSSVLTGIIAQRLLPRIDAPGRVMASEIMVVNQGIQAAIHDHRFEQVFGLMQLGGVHGMHTYDQSLLHLTKGGHITLEEALLNSRHPDDLQTEFQEWLREQQKKKKR